MTALVEVDTARWDALLQRLGCADAYLLRGYLESACVLEPSRPALLHLEGSGGDVVFPLLVRDAPGGRFDVTTPYGFGGPVATGDDPPLEKFWELYERWCETNAVVTSFFHFHPLFANHAYAGPGVRVEPRAGTVGWRLTEPDLFAAMDGAHRTACRKAEREGVSVTVRRAPDDLSAFVALYEQTMERVEARSFYFFGSEYWESLVKRLRERLLLVDAEAGGAAVASALCLATPPWLHYHLGATGERGRALGATTLLLYETARWAREAGFERFHLGGGVGGADDSLLAFKRRFDPDGVLESAIGKAVHDAAAYRELAGADPGDLEGFFPLYRAG